MRVAEEAIAVLEDLDDLATQERQEDLAFLERCESPVEQILVATILTRWPGAMVNSYFNRIQCELSSWSAAPWQGLFQVLLQLQKPVRTAESQYRCDLYLSLTRFWRGGNCPEWGRLVVEVDGHDFHDRTKTQASRDRRRDRLLMREGLSVIRFTGSDVYHHADNCVDEIREQLELLADQVFEQFRCSGRLEELLGGPLWSGDAR